MTSHHFSHIIETNTEGFHKVLQILLLKICRPQFECLILHGFIHFHSHYLPIHRHFLLLCHVITRQLATGMRDFVSCRSGNHFLFLVFLLQLPIDTLLHICSSFQEYVRWFPRSAQTVSHTVRASLLRVPGNSSSGCCMGIYCRCNWLNCSITPQGLLRLAFAFLVDSFHNVFESCLAFECKCIACTCGFVSAIPAHRRCWGIYSSANRTLPTLGNITVKHFLTPLRKPGST